MGAAAGRVFFDFIQKAIAPFGLIWYIFNQEQWSSKTTNQERAMKIISKRKCEVTIQRPDGTVETIIHPKVDYMNDGLLKAANKAMAAAGKGTFVSYRNIDAVVEMEESDYLGPCERCGEKVDSRTAYSQLEWSRIGGKKVRVQSHYCEGCRRTLQAVGMGEVSAMDERATTVPSCEPTTKQD